MVIQLANRSNVYPRGVLKDVLVFPTDFYILDIEDEVSYNPTPILLGRPFLKIAQAMINVHDGVLTMEFDGKVIKFNLFEAMKYPSGHGDELEFPQESIHCSKE